MSKKNSDIEKIFLQKWSNKKETLQNLTASIQEIVKRISHFDLTKNDFVFISDSEDTEIYGKAAIDSLTEKFGKEKIKLICNWVITHKEQGTYFSSIQKTYVEDYSKESPHFIFFSRAVEQDDFSNLIVQITRYITQAKEPSIFICTPIQDTEFDKRVQREFPSEIAQRMNFIHIIEQAESPEYNQSLYNYTNAYKKYLNEDLIEEIIPELVKERRVLRFKTSQT